MSDTENASVKRVEPNKEKDNKVDKEKDTKEESKSDEKSEESKSSDSEKTESKETKTESKDDVKEKDSKNYSADPIDTESVDPDDSEEDKSEIQRKLEQQASAVKGQIKMQSAVASSQIGIMTMLFVLLRKALLMLKMLAIQAAMALYSLFGAAVAAIAGFFQALGAAIMSAANAVVSAIMTTLAVGATAAATIAIAPIVCVVLVGAAAAVAISYPSGYLDGVVEDCATQVDAVRDSQNSDMDVNVVMFQNAQKIFSVLSSYGLSDTQVAAVLGNFQHESGIFAHRIEATSASLLPGDPAWEKAMSDLNQHCIDVVFPNTPSANPELYKGTDGKYYCGIGLAQFTASNAQTIVELGNSNGRNWYDLDFQMACILALGTDLTTGAKGGQNFWNTFKAETASMSLADATFYFQQYYEGNSSSAVAQRLSNAEGWASQLSSWSIDSGYASSIIELANTLNTNLSANAMGNALDKCVKEKDYDNSTMAAAAVSYAYPTESQGAGNNGTDLYQTVHDNVFPGDPYYQSCDRGVACAVRWSGSDDTYPQGPTATQYTYLKTSPKWECVVETFTLADIGKLQPGDVFCTKGDGHTFMYVGADLIAEKHGDAASFGSDMVSASFMERSPGCGNLSGTISSDSRAYSVFRCVQPDKSQTYVNAGSAA